MNEIKTYNNINRTTDTTVDLFKFIFCIEIIALHTHVLNLLPGSYYFINIFVRLAVPYFFVASGYYLRKKYVNKNTKTYKEILFSFEKRLLYPYIFFMLIALRQCWTTYMLNGMTQKEIFKNLLKDAFFYPRGALWFVFALIIAALISYPFMKMKNGVNLCLMIGCFFFLFALICNNYYFVVLDTPLQPFVDFYMKHFVSARNGLFVGLIFVSLGMKCYDLHSIVESKKKFVSVFLMFFFSIYVVEVFVLKYLRCERIDDKSLYVMQLVLIPVLFLFSILFPINISSNRSTLMRNLSTGIYYLHRPILWWVAFYFSNEIIVFIIVLIIAFTICIISYKFEFKNK